MRGHQCRSAVGVCAANQHDQLLADRHRGQSVPGVRDVGRLHMKSRWRAPRLSASDGFTLVELLVSMVAGIVVVLATFATFDASVRQSLAASDRVEATQNG